MGAVLIAFVLVPLGMLPTVGAYISDRTPEKYAALCVLITNSCGVLVSVIKLMAQGGGAGQALEFALEAQVWAGMYGAAGAGWLVHMGVPVLVDPVRERVWARRIARLEARRGKLADEWGPFEAAEVR